MIFRTLTFVILLSPLAGFAQKGSTFQYQVRIAGVNTPSQIKFAYQTVDDLYPGSKVGYSDELNILKIGSDYRINRNDLYAGLLVHDITLVDLSMAVGSAIPNELGMNVTIENNPDSDH